MTHSGVKVALDEKWHRKFTQSVSIDPFNRQSALEYLFALKIAFAGSNDCLALQISTQERTFSEREDKASRSFRAEDRAQIIVCSL
jgi:hypothetical protein